MTMLRNVRLQLLFVLLILTCIVGSGGDVALSKVIHGASALTCPDGFNLCPQCANGMTDMCDRDEDCFCDDNFCVIAGVEVHQGCIRRATAAVVGSTCARAAPPRWDVEGRVAYFPTFNELHERLFGVTPDPEDNSTHVVIGFQNKYDIRPNFKSYPHSNLLAEFFTDLLDILALEGGPRFVVEVGSLHGHSAVQMATVLDKLGLMEVPILCIDPFTGDANMWASWQEDLSVRGWVNIRDGRMTVFDQFMANVQFAVSRTVEKNHILPFHATSTVGARWLHQTGYTPDLIFLDSAHEEHETFMEISFYYSILVPGGILFGDDYGWEAVRKDVHRFVDEHTAAYGEKEPLSFRVVRAKAGAHVSLWIIQKPKLR